MKYFALCALSLLLTTVALAETPRYQPGISLKDQLLQLNLWNSDTPLRLHLGCGEQRFPGYVNVDFPPSEHTVQQNIAADIYADITTITLPDESVQEIRNHHIFEHFERPNALALLCTWHRWLVVGGELVIETPDFEATARIVLDQNQPYHIRQAALRHLFGSHEARWAVHCDGWYAEKFYRNLSRLGFTDIVMYRLESRTVVPSILVRARKTHPSDSQQMAQAVREILRESLVGPGEDKLYNTWVSFFEQAMSKSAYLITTAAEGE